MFELIRNGKVEAALEFAQEELALRGEENVIISLISQLHKPDVIIRVIFEFEYLCYVDVN